MSCASGARQVDVTIIVFEALRDIDHPQSLLEPSDFLLFVQEGKLECPSLPLRLLELLGQCVLMAVGCGFKTKGNLLYGLRVVYVYGQNCSG